MSKTTQKEKKEKLTPKPCICGSAAVVVKSKGKKLISCPNPERCKRNLRTMWHGHELSAIAEWNNLIDSCRYGGS